MLSETLISNFAKSTNRISNISPTRLALQLMHTLPLLTAANASIWVHSGDLGCLKGVIRWKFPADRVRPKGSARCKAESKRFELSHIPDRKTNVSLTSSSVRLEFRSIATIKTPSHLKDYFLLEQLASCSFALLATTVQLSFASSSNKKKGEKKRNEFTRKFR